MLVIEQSESFKFLLYKMLEELYLVVRDWNRRMKPVAQFPEEAVPDGFVRGQVFVVLDHGLVDEGPHFLQLRHRQWVQHLLGQLRQMRRNRLGQRVGVACSFLFLSKN
jgi:hypothetical protein